MTFKHILSFIFATIFALAADFLPPDQAFKVSVQNNAVASDFRIELAPKIYLYLDKIHATHDGVDITADLELPKGVIHDDERVLYEVLDFQLPKFAASGKLRLDFQGCSEDGLCYQPMSAYFQANNSAWELEKLEQNTLAQEQNDAENSSEIELATDESKFTNALANGSWLGTLALFAGFGVLLSLTPCVLPMLPILSSILAKKSGSHAFISSLVYVIFMALAYAVLGVAAALAGGSFASTLQHPLIQLAFAVLFVLLALSSFGLFELALPSRLQNFARFGDRTPGLLGAALMGVLSALLVGPCVAAPLAGALVYIASTNDVFFGAAALFVLGLGMGVPLIVLAAGFSMLKTGAWMIKVNRFFGFLLLGVAVFFASAVLGKIFSFVLYALILCAFAADFELTKMPKNAKYFLAKLFMWMFIIAAFFVIAHEYWPQNFEKADSRISFITVKNEAEFHIKRPSLLYFTAKWCENCEIYHNEVFPKVQKDLEKYDLFKIDLTSANEFEKKMAQKYQVFGPPVIVVFDKSGKQLKKITGLESPQNLHKILQN